MKRDGEVSLLGLALSKARAAVGNYGKFTTLGLPRLEFLSEQRSGV